MRGKNMHEISEQGRRGDMKEGKRRKEKEKRERREWEIKNNEEKRG